MLKSVNDKKLIFSLHPHQTVHAYTTETVNQALDAGAECIDHAQMVDEKTIKRIKKNGVFLVSNLTGMSDEIMKHPYYGNPNPPSYLKTKQFMDGSRNFVNYINKYQPKSDFGDDLFLSTQSVFRRGVDFEKWYAGKLFGNHYALKGMTSVPGELAQLTGKNSPNPKQLGLIKEGAYADILLVEGNPP